jgi:type IV pilus assembly protein PilC
MPAQPPRAPVAPAQPTTRVKPADTNVTRRMAVGGGRPGTPVKQGWMPAIMKKSLQSASLAVFYRSLATMFQAGVRIERALELLAEQSDDPKMGEICSALGRSIATGQTMSHAMSQWSEAFSPMEIKLVQVGETTGKLDHILERLSKYEEKRRAVTMRIKSALTYPIFIFIVAFVSLVILPPYLFGGLFQLIEGLGVEVPLITKVVLIFSHVVGSSWFLVGLGIFVVAALKFVPELMKRPDVQMISFQIILRLPVLGPACRIVTITRFARALEIMVNVGIPLDQAMTMAFDAASNPVLKKSLPTAVENLRAGQTLTECLQTTEFFPNAFLYMVNVGEESGKLPTLLGNMAHLYEVELTYALETVIAALEPLMLMVMGVVVGIFIVATMMPMMAIIQNLK